MKKLLLAVLLSLILSGNAFTEIIFRAECENPKGIRFSEDILHMQDNKKSLVDFEQDKFSGSDKIELIYDTNKKDQIHLCQNKLFQQHQLFLKHNLQVNLFHLSLSF